MRSHYGEPCMTLTTIDSNTKKFYAEFSNKTIFNNRTTFNNYTDKKSIQQTILQHNTLYILGVQAGS